MQKNDNALESVHRLAWWKTLSSLFGIRADSITAVQNNFLPLLESTTAVCPFPAPPQGSLTEALLHKGRMF